MSMIADCYMTTETVWKSFGANVNSVTVLIWWPWTT